MFLFPALQRTNQRPRNGMLIKMVEPRNRNKEQNRDKDNKVK